MTSPNSKIYSRGGVFFACFVAGSLMFACGSDDEDGGDNPEGDDGIGSGIKNINDKNTNTQLTSDSEGGSVDLSSEQVTRLETASCIGWAAEGENLPATLQLVVDASSSMSANAPGNNRSKWDVTSEALASAIDSLPASMSVGMLHYPNLATTDGGPCVNADAMTPIAQLGQARSDHRGVLDDSLAEATLNSGTPTYEAYNTALNEGLVPYQSANRFMLLITDGAPTIDQGCVFGTGGGNLSDAPTQPIIDSISTAYSEHGIRTFVIGSPGSEQSADGNGDMRPWLSQAAMAGGTDSAGCSATGPNYCHMDMTQDADFATSLRAGLTAVVGQIIDACTFSVPDAPQGEEIDPNLTNLVVTWSDGGSTLILPDAGGACDEGWHFNDKGEIELCPASCEKIKVDDQARVQLTFGCDSEEVVGIR